MAILERGARVVALALALLVCATRVDATVKYLAINGFEDPASETAFWWWDSASGGGITYETNVSRGGTQSAAMDCSTSQQTFFHAFYDELTQGTAVTGEGNTIIGCVWARFPSGSISNTGLTDWVGMDLASSGHGNNTGKALIRFDGNDGWQLGGDNCTTTTNTMTIDDDEWHQWCIGYSSSGGTGSVKAWVDRDTSLPASDSCTTGAYTNDPDGFKITCIEAVGNPVTASRYVDDVVVLLNPGTQESVRASDAAVERLQIESTYASSGVVLLGDCSAQTALACVDGTYTEPGNGTDNNNAGTHAVKLDDNADCAAWRFKRSDALSGSLPEKVYAWDFAVDLVETTTNSQTEFRYNSDPTRTLSSACASTSGDQTSGAFNADNALRLHKWQRGVASDGTSEITGDMQSDVVIGLDKVVGSGNVRIEAWYVQALVAWPPAYGFTTDARTSKERR